MHPFVLLPVKSLAEGKSRLADALDHNERRRLNEWLLARSITTALMLTRATRVVVVSDCSAALALADARGARAFRPQTAGDLNAALAEAHTTLAAEAALPMLVVAVDLPLVRAADLLAVVVAGTTRERVVICPDRHGSGTNALLLPPRTSLPFRFGPGSAAAHAEAARAAGCAVIVWPSARIAFDLDTPADLADWRVLSPVEGG